MAVVLMDLSAEQLSEMWHLDFQYAEELLGFPRRSCSAQPSKTWGKAMEEREFQACKEKSRYMWLVAAVLFSSEKSDSLGLGLVASTQRNTSLSLPPRSVTELGWLARAPTPQECCTGHRYLRSPIMHKKTTVANSEDTIYLGGPISLANWSSKPTVKCQRRLNHPTMTVMTHKPLEQGTPVVWTYEIDELRKDELPNLTPQSEWQMTGCCTEGPCEDEHEPPRKKGKSYKIPARSKKNDGLCQSFRHCTICGENVEAQVDVTPNNNRKRDLPPKKNIKTHWATTHAVEICNAMNIKIDDELSGVDVKDFKTYLHIMSLLLDMLKSHGYNVRPASHIFKILGTKQYQKEEDQEKCREFFCKFLNEAGRAFSAYQVVFLRGISFPRSYEDLLTPPKTDYSDIAWKNGKIPPSNTFSAKGLLSENENSDINVIVGAKFLDIISKCRKNAALAGEPNVAVADANA